MRLRSKEHITFLFFVLILALAPFIGIAQYNDSSDIDNYTKSTEVVSLQPFDSTEWKKITQALDYGEIEKKTPKETRQRSRTGTSDGAATLMQILLIAAGIALFGFPFLHLFQW